MTVAATGVPFVATRRELRLVEWANYPPREVLANVNGRAEVRYGPVPAGKIWAVERLTIYSDSTTVPIFRWYLGDPKLYNIMEATDNGDFDAAEYPTAVPVGQGLSVVGVWTGAQEGDRCWLRLQYKVYEWA